ncbi:MAG: cupin [Rhodospirillaceae bacterium]|nr:cupin [Rhodospirillaceae bacterium]
MRLNANFDQTAQVFDAENAWVPSPMAGVERKMLDRIGDEVARATTVVRFAPESFFSAHTHDGGEEFLVLDGVFQDEHGDYPQGYYIRNPPTSHHVPSAANGCTILVKLHQFDPDDRAFTKIDTNKSFFIDAADRPGVAIMPLFQDARECVRLETWTADADIGVDTDGGLEVFVITGSFDFGNRTFGPWDWLRLPPGGEEKLRSGLGGAKIYVKSGHLRDMVRA